MKAPKFPLYPLTLFFVLGMTLLFQLTQKWLWVAVSIIFILGLFKKTALLFTSFFFPLGDSINNNTIKSQRITIEIYWVRKIRYVLQ